MQWVEWMLFLDGVESIAVEEEKGSGRFDDAKSAVVKLGGKTRYGVHVKLPSISVVGGFRCRITVRSYII